MSEVAAEFIANVRSPENAWPEIGSIRSGVQTLLTKDGTFKSFHIGGKREYQMKQEDKAAMVSSLKDTLRFLTSLEDVTSKDASGKKAQIWRQLIHRRLLQALVLPSGSRYELRTVRVDERCILKDGAVQ